MSVCVCVCVCVCREETEIIEGEVVEVQIDRPTTASVSVLSLSTENLWAGCT